MRGAGHALVQVVRHTRTHEEYALKAFAAPGAFHAEAALYTDPSGPLAAFLPRLRALLDNADGTFRDPHGHKMPPCIMMEKGESLAAWCRREEPNRLQIYEVWGAHHHSMSEL